MPTGATPTLAHFFIAALHQHGRLKRSYSQNICMLDKATLDEGLIVHVHGNVDEAMGINGRSEQKLPPSKRLAAEFSAALRDGTGHPVMV